MVLNLTCFQQFYWHLQYQLQICTLSSLLCTSFISLCSATNSKDVYVFEPASLGHILTPGRFVNQKVQMWLKSFHQFYISLQRTTPVFSFGVSTSFSKLHTNIPDVSEYQFFGHLESLSAWIFYILGCP